MSISEGKHGNAAAGHPQVAETAYEILQAGGNAFDAVVAATLVSTLAEPMLGSLGGGGLLLAKTQDSKYRFFDFFVDFPGLGRANLEFELEPLHVQFGSAMQTFYIGPHSICTPGVLKGLIHIHTELGQMPLKEIVQPAIQFAREGIEVDHIQAYVTRVLYPIMVQTPKGKELFTRDSELIKPGDIFKNPEFADYLETLPETKGEDIYNGELGRSLLQELEGKTLLTEKDLSNFEVIERDPEEYQYRSHKVFTSPRPALGGVMMTALLDAMAHHHLPDFVWGSPKHLTELAEAMVTVENNKELILSNKFTKGTTHISVTDKDGRCASFSMSNGQGSGYFVPGTGIMMNNMLGEDDLFNAESEEVMPGERIPSMMSPTILERDDGKTFVMGAGGSKRIRSSIMQTLSNIADFKKPIGEAVDSPRINWDGELFQVEKGLRPESLNALEAKYTVNEWPDIAFYFGGVHTAQLFGPAHGDPRRGGSGKF